MIFERLGRTHGSERQWRSLRPPVRQPAIHVAIGRNGRGQRPVTAALRPSSPGFRIDDRVVASFQLPQDVYGDPASARRFANDLIASIERSTGATAAVTTDLPLTGTSAYIQAEQGSPGGEPTGVHFRAVSAGYHELMAMR
jgi:hypothetical protein